ncbi:MAG: Ig-like domain-containing protein [Gemmatimonadota bacterium]|nr:Ig-like domain-containing protein [Gemmatimonadota bacterium]
MSRLAIWPFVFLAIAQLASTGLAAQGSSPRPAALDQLRAASGSLQGAAVTFTPADASDVRRVRDLESERVIGVLESRSPASSSWPAGRYDIVLRGGDDGWHAYAWSGGRVVRETSRVTVQQISARSLLERPVIRAATLRLVATPCGPACTRHVPQVPHVPAGVASQTVVTRHVLTSRARLPAGSVLVTEDSIFIAWSPPPLEQPVQLHAVVTDSRGEVVSGRTHIEWSSDQPDVYPVSQDGIVTAHLRYDVTGATITASSPGLAGGHSYVGRSPRPAPSDSAAAGSFWQIEIIWP